MSIITTLTRTWLTRSVRPFTFKNEYDETLPFAECENLGLYIHIPFCKSICNFCPYCKVKYTEEACEQYVTALRKEISMVGSRTEGKKQVTSLYFGGGTPALATEHLAEIIGEVRNYFDITEGVGIELHPDNVTVPLLTMLKEAGVTKLSIDVQSFQEKYQTMLRRTSVDAAALKGVLSKVPFETVSMDFIFALPGQAFEDLKADIDMAFANGANHIAIYPFIDFTFTDSTDVGDFKKTGISGKN